METDSGNQTLFQIQVSDGQLVYVAVDPDDTMGEFQSRLEKAGLSIDVSKLNVDGSAIDGDTNVIQYFSLLEKSGQKSPLTFPCEDNEDEISSGLVDEGEEDISQLVDEDTTAVETLHLNEFSDEKEDQELELNGIFCAVPSCTANKFNHPEVTFFPLPAQKRRCMVWIDSIGRFDLADQPVAELSSQFVVCSQHFDESDFLDKDHQALKLSAVPTILNQEELETIQEDDGNNANQVALEVFKNPDKFVALPVSCKIEEELEEAEDELVHPGSLCRLCATPVDGLPLFIFEGDGGESQTIADKINACLPIVVKKTDPLPKQICKVCSQHLDLHNSFTESCLKAEQKLQLCASKFLVNGLPKPMSAAQDGRRNRSKQTLNYCCPLCCTGAMRYLSSEDGCNDESTEGEKQPAASTEVVSQSALNELYSDDEEEDAGGGTPIKDEVTEEDENTGQIYLPEDKNLLTYECDVCEESFAGGAECLEHAKIVHSVEDYFPCIVCGLIFDSDLQLTQHFEEHKFNVVAPRRCVWKSLLECGTCEVQFTTRKDFILHKCSKPVLHVLQTDSHDLTCHPCDRTFLHKGRRNAHRNLHEGGEMSTCNQCGFQLETEKMLQHHISMAHDIPTAFDCGECELRFMTKVHLDKHTKVHLRSTVYQCSSCDKTFKTLEAINWHIQQAHAEVMVASTDFCCPKCDQIYIHKSMLQHHLETAHDSIKRMPSLIQYQCNVCSERITTSSEVLGHRTVHFPIKDPQLPYVCEYCGDAHPSPNALARHRRYLHPDEHPYVCTLCNVTTRTLYEARVHRKTHTGYVAAPHKPQPKIYQCEMCPSLFSDKFTFLSHKKSHKISKWYQCDHCDKAFPERHRLIVHKRQHTGEKPFSCGTCGKKFAQTSAMYTHALLHTGETPHKCDICNRKFRIKSDRDNHRRTHTGEKPYKCEYCSKTFRTGQVYYQHRMIHTGERRFPCDICGRAFKRSHTLACHRRIHTGEKPNVCDICGKGFRQRTDMRKHKMNLHGVSA